MTCSAILKGMTVGDKEREDLFYVGSLIEHVGRKTKNRRGDVVRAMSDETIRHQL